MINDVADSVGVPMVGGEFRKERTKGFVKLAPQSDSHGLLIEKAVMALLTQLSGAVEA